MKKILLVQANYFISRKSGVWALNPPIGLCYIGAMLEKNGLNVDILDANKENLTPKEASERARGYDIVGVSLLTPAQKWAVEFINYLPKNVLKVVGGPHATALPEDIVRQGFDIAVRGEGEYTFLKIVNGENPDNIDGITYKKGKMIINNPDSCPVDPNEIPLPARHLIEKGGTDKPYISAGTKYTPWACIFTSRGCPYNCNFCLKKIFGYKFRPRTPENVVNEIEHLVKTYGVKEIAIYDDNWNMDLDRANKILDLIIDRGLKIKIRTTNGMRVDRVNEEFLRKLKKAGCNYVAYGIESGSQEVLNKIPKAITLDQVREAVRLTKKVGIPITGFMMMGLIGDTEETMQKTIDFTKELDLDVVAWNMATPYPGTRLFDEIKENGKFLFNLDNWEDIQHTSGKMVFTHPDVAPPEVVEKYYAKAHKEFYLRPIYVIRQLLMVRNLTQLKLIINGGLGVLRATLRKPFHKNKEECIDDNN